MTEPTLISIKPRFSFLPELRSRWWTGLLGVSLMANLLVGGVVLGAKMRHGAGSFAFLENRAQLLPRNFIAELPKERRRELMSIFEAKREQFLLERTTADAVTLKFADILDRSDFDPAKLKTVVDEFTSGSASIASQGNGLILDVVSKLTPEERSKLAKMIRDRAAHSPRK
jgi:uncharacterized membrane protein